MNKHPINSFHILNKDVYWKPIHGIKFAVLFRANVDLNPFKLNVETKGEGGSFSGTLNKFLINYNAPSFITDPDIKTIYVNVDNLDITISSGMSNIDFELILESF